MNGAGDAGSPGNAAGLPRAPARRSAVVQFVRYVLTTGTHVAAVRPFSTLTRRKCSRREENSHPSMIGTPRASENRITRFGPNRCTSAAGGGRNAAEEEQRPRARGRGGRGRGEPLSPRVHVRVGRGLPEEPREQHEVRGLEP